MARWEPDARGRLERAAMELYGERGFESTTVADISERAGLTERTFYRHFADKREVLFWGAGSLEAGLVATVGAAPAATPPFEAIVAALEAAGPGFEERREFAVRRQAIISASPELHERELIKLAKLAAALASALRRRGQEAPAACLAAEAAVAIFKVAFTAWTEGTGVTTLSECIRETAAELRRVTSGPVMVARG